METSRPVFRAPVQSLMHQFLLAMEWPSATDWANFGFAAIGILIAGFALRQSHQSNVLAKRALQQQEDASKKKLGIYVEPAFERCDKGKCYFFKIWVTNHGVRVIVDKAFLYDATDGLYSPATFEFATSTHIDKWLETNDRWEGSSMGSIPAKPRSMDEAQSDGDYQHWLTFSTSRTIVVETKCGHIEYYRLPRTMAQLVAADAL